VLRTVVECIAIVVRQSFEGRAAEGADTQPGAAASVGYRHRRALLKWWVAQHTSSAEARARILYFELTPN
jgi:hypothetical protein